MILLLTATIDPMGCAHVGRVDPDIRRKDYYDNIKRFLDETDVEIVFVENSGFDLGEIKEFLTNDRVEILQFNGNNYPRNLGKGFGEMILINYAIVNSLKLKNIDYIIKLTGRYYFDYNSIKDILQNNDFVIYKRETDFSQWYVCTGFYKVPKQFWLNDFSHRHVSDDPGCYMETNFAQALDPFRDNIFEVDMELIGISGTNNKPMINGLHV